MLYCISRLDLTSKTDLDTWQVRWSGQLDSTIPSCCLALLEQVSSKMPGPVPNELKSNRPPTGNPCRQGVTHTYTHREPYSALA